ncbi:tRNA epoxyqueuosine(34) reductase QueG [Desulfuribacillus alkaliarsenatis]|uniref:tRNA epoxyqueuosine(34) reductase QueG n=1 Tax=Desulfuribacillus alkaliarsenatis TaxID=766136 RepID=A0A1E5G0M6_9FIRM|nr:tRNA epoxyqueuosine(34) reductase QueG [Desulfuribacillus alkaliarsenatis]OEF96466.1 tRNA epoxyqueuosine(34) reductase QueG [Desulfuribacillus alkaliarsenatis]
MKTNERITEFSREIGIDAIGFTKAERQSDLLNTLVEHSSQGFQSGWEETDIEKRVNPKLSLKDAKTIIVIALNYHNIESKMYETKRSDNRGRISKAAWGIDYHQVLNKKLEQLSQYIIKNIDADAKSLAFVDTGPMVDRELAVRAGIGFYGMNCNIIHPELGSFIFIGSLLTTVDIEPSNPTDTKCFACNKCIEHCPTGAIIKPYKINSKKCLAYLTLTKGEHGHGYQTALNDHIYGCDICQDVCPHNKDIPLTKHQEFVEQDEVKYPNLIELLTISNKDFKAKYGHSSGAWRGKKPWQRNAMLLIGKRKLHEAIPALKHVITRDPREDMRLLAEDTLKNIKNIK